MKTVMTAVEKNILEVGDLVTLKEGWEGVERKDGGTSGFWCRESGLKEGMIYEVSGVSPAHNIRVSDNDSFLLNPNCFQLVTLTNL